MAGAGIASGRAALVTLGVAQPIRLRIQKRVQRLLPGTSWDAVGTGDFNADGKADILWQNTDGTPAIWMMDGTTLTGMGVLPSPGMDWHLISSESKTGADACPMRH